MFDFVTVLVGGFAAYRLSLLVTRENGPARIFFNLRRFVDLKFGVNSSLAEGISCPFCVSFWFSLLIAWPPSTSAYNWIVTALAMATIAVILLKFFRTA